MMKILLLFCVIAVFGFNSVNGEFSKEYTKYKWCCKSQAEKKRCDVLAGRPIFDFECVQTTSTPACIQKIVDNDAHVMTLDAGDIFDYQDAISVIGSENTGVSDASYYAIAAVLADASPDISIANNNTKKTCHTGIGKTAGWVMPMGYFARNDIKLESITSACAPGANDNKYSDLLPKDQCGTKWCSLCQGNGQGDFKCDRNNNEQFYGYDGALKCITEQEGDIAFIKHTTIPSDKYDDYEIFCQNGTRVSPDKWEECNLGRVPSHGVVTSSTKSEVTKAAIFKKLEDYWDSPSRAAFDNKNNLLWSKNVQSFQNFTGSVDDFLGDEYRCAVSKMYGFACYT